MNMLRIENLHVRAGEFTLADISLSVARGEYLVIMGPTGSGKSLLIKSVCGLIGIERGRIFIDGNDVTALEPKFRRIGYLPQNTDLFPHLSVERNITFPLDVAGKSQRQTRAGIGPVVEMLGLSPLLNRSTVHLSGGERQMVALARALTAKPTLLLLDEPVSALDEPTRAETCAILRRVQRQVGIATVHVCHSREEARFVADRIGIMSQGRLVQVAPFDELASSPADPVVTRLLFGGAKALAGQTP